MVQLSDELKKLPSTKLYFQIGETILTEGDRSDGWFVLLSGKVAVYKRDFSVAEISTPGTVIGELGFLLNIPRTATLIALEPTLLLRARIGVDKLFEEYPKLAKEVMLILAERLVKTTADWRESVERVGVL